MIRPLSGESQCIAICLVSFFGIAPSLHAQASSTSDINSRLEVVSRVLDIEKKISDLSREIQQKSDAAGYLQLYRLIYKADPDRSKKIAQIDAKFPYAKEDQDVRDILAADEKGLEKNPHPQEEEYSLDPAGLLYLRERTSVRNIDGKVIDLPSFTIVRRLSSKGDTFRVAEGGGNAFDVPKDKLDTGRPDVAAMAQRKQQEAAQLTDLLTTMLKVLAQQTQH